MGGWWSESSEGSGRLSGSEGGDTRGRGLAHKARAVAEMEHSGVVSVYQCRSTN